MRTIVLTFAAATIAFFIDLALATAAIRLTRVPPNFPPFTLLPILSGAVGGAILASLVYAAARALSPAPDRLFFFLTFAAFTLSLGLPLRLSFTRSLRFSGVTPAAQMMLVLMHAVVSVVSFITLTARQDV